MRFRPGRPVRRGGPFQRRLPGGPRQALRAAALQALERAHRLLQAGRAAEAAATFAQLAAAAATSGMPRQAANLHLRAAQGHTLARAGSPALDQARRALKLLLATGGTAQLAQALPRLIAEMRQQGLIAEADQFQKEFGAAMGELPPAEPMPAAPRGRLPAQCPNCSGPIRADEVEWIEASDDADAPILAPTAACPYCGSVLHIE